jgi:hypothetical protein
MMKPERVVRVLGAALLFGLFFWVLDGVLSFFYFRTYLRFM